MTIDIEKQPVVAELTIESPAQIKASEAEVSSAEGEPQDLKTDEEIIAETHNNEMLHEDTTTAFDRLSRHLAWSRLRWVVLPFFAILVGGWWISGLCVTATRVTHRIVPTTIFTVFIEGMIFFSFVPAKIFAKPIGKYYTITVADPWMRLPKTVRYSIGWLSLLALVFGSAFGFPLPAGTTYGQRAISVFGLFVFNCFYYACSKNRKLIKWQTVIMGLIFQQALALFVLKSGAGLSLFAWIATAAADFLGKGGEAGTFFLPASLESSYFVGTLSAVIFFVAFAQLLFYLGALQWAISKFAWFFFKTMSISGAESVVAAASPFIGQGESSMLVKPFVDFMTPSELHTVMCSGFSTVSGSVLIAYVNLGVPKSTIITASMMSIPASIAISKMRYPEDDVPITLGRVVIDRGDEDKHGREANFLHAFSNGAWFGLKIAGLILCNVLVILALLYVVDGVLTWIGLSFAIPNLTLELIFSYLFYPLAFLLGAPYSDLLHIGSLLGLKLFGNEFIAYSALMKIEGMTDRGFIIATYCLCGFANLGSLGIQMGVLSGLAPSRGKIIAKIGPSALMFGFLSTMQTAIIAGMLV